MATNYKGREFLIYALTTAPSSPEIAAEYTVVGTVTDLSVTRSRNAIEDSSKDDGDETSVIAGRRSNTISGTANWDHTSDAGQLMFTTAYTSAAGTIWFLITSATAGDQEFHGSGVVTQADIALPDEGISSLSFSVAVNGALTEVAGT